MKLEFLHRFSKHTNFTKIRPVGSEMFHVDRQTDRQACMPKLIVTFHNSANAPKETGKDNQRKKVIRTGQTKDTGKPDESNKIRI